MAPSPSPLTTKVIFVLGVTMLGLYSVTSVPTARGKVKVPPTLIQKLFNLTAAQQTTKDEPLVPFKQWYKASGVYSSGVKLNFHGDFELAEARRMLNVFDNNMFVTAWVTSSLLEAYWYGAAPEPSEFQLLAAISALKSHVDLNKPYTSGGRTFWPQAYNQTVKYWQSTPVNLLSAFEIAGSVPLNVTLEILELLGLKELAPYVEGIIKSKNIFLQAFHIPPDFDDTFVNLGLGSLLFKMSEQFTVPWGRWNAQNTNITSVFDALKRYAYRPFSSDPDQNSIDPRSYMYIRNFLDDAKNAGKDVALVTTWMQSINELRTEYSKGVSMPFQVNNVDVTVCANTVFGITSLALSGLSFPIDFLKDPAIEQIYHNTSALIAYEIKNNMTNRPDLALLYYPSQIEFDWFVSRTFAILEEAKQKGPLPFPVMESVYQMLKGVTQGEMTKYILSKGIHEDAEKVFYDDFLGNGDVTNDKRPFMRAEDRIFTTAMAANALLYTWTIFNETDKTTSWRQDTPDIVKETVNGCIRWLTEHTLDGNYDPWNAFFSGSGKGSTTLPFWYPANRYEYLNGTAKSFDQFPTFADVLAVQGYVPRDQYEDMVKQKHFGHETPLVFHGYNSEPGFFPLWSSVPYTYATTLLALSRYDKIVG